MNETLALTLGVILVVLLALVVGLVIPVLVQFRRTLAVAENRLEHLADDFGGLVHDVRRVLKRVDTLTEAVEEGRPALSQMIEAVTGLSHTVKRIDTRVRQMDAVSAAVVPAVVAAVRTWRTARASSDGDGAGTDMTTEPPPRGGERFEEEVKHG